MKLKSVINKLEKVTGNKVKQEGNTYWISGIGNEVAFFHENGIGSGDASSICIRPKVYHDENPMNRNCYDAFYRTIKSAALALV